jgi:hypothetical protein
MPGAALDEDGVTEKRLLQCVLWQQAGLPVKWFGGIDPLLCREFLVW